MSRIGNRDGGHAGNRGRGGGGGGGGGGGVRWGDAKTAHQPFNSLSADEKMKRRKEERMEKKERERTLSYFVSVKRAMDEYQSAGTGDPSVLTSILDGFFTELIKRLKADPTLHIMRNGLVCRVVEQALANSVLLQGKTLLFVFLGHIAELLLSPVASYVVETLLAGIAQGLSSVAASDTEAFEQEMVVGGPGCHTASGVPSSATLVNSLVEEIVESMGDVMVSDSGARALRSIILVMGGFTVRNAPPLAYPVRFEEQLEQVAQCIVERIEANATTDPRGAMDAWLEACRVPTVSFLIQSLLRTCDEDHVPRVDQLVRQRIEELGPRPGARLGLLKQLLLDSAGCHVFQAFVRVPTPKSVVEHAKMVLQRRSPMEQKKQHMLASMGFDDDNDSDKRGTKRESKADPSQGSDASTPVKISDAEASKVFCSRWDTALSVFDQAQSSLLGSNSELVLQSAYVIQDFALFAPTALHLEKLWSTVFETRLQQFLEIPALLAALVRFTRKCAFGSTVGSSVLTRTHVSGAGGRGAEENPRSDASSSGPVTAFEEEVRKDIAQGATYFSTPLSLRKNVGTLLFYSMKGEKSSRQVARSILVDVEFGEKGVELVHNVLCFGKEASSGLSHSIQKMRAEDLVTVSMHPKGSFVIQQLLRNGAVPTAPAAPAAAPSTAVPHAHRASGGKESNARPNDRVPHRQGGGGHAGGEGDHFGGAASKSTAYFFLRRTQAHLEAMIQNKYAAYVIECLYEIGDMELKELLVEALVPLHQSMRTVGGGVKRQREEDAADYQGEEAEMVGGAQGQFIAAKVMEKLCVEQYIHRPDDWRKSAQRMSQVQRLVLRMLRTEDEL